jgi:hypothetical protein
MLLTGGAYRREAHWDETFIAGKSRRLYKTLICCVSLIPRRCDVPPKKYASLLGIQGPCI